MMVIIGPNRNEPVLSITKGEKHTLLVLQVIYKVGLGWDYFVTSI